jgi:hypothetical protein
MTVVFSSLSSMGALDLEEVKDTFSRQDAAYRILEQSVRDYMSHADTEKEAFESKISQLEILLKSRQGALVAKERECERLRSRKPNFSLTCSVGKITIESVDEVKKSATPAVWLSTCVGVARVVTDTTNRPLLTTRSVPVISVAPSEEIVKSPPATVFRREHVRSPPDISLSPRRIVIPSSSSSLRRTAARESFTSVRSSRTIRSLADDDNSSSDESLNELVSNAMRLSAASFRSSTSSLGRKSFDSNRASSSSFPKRWK